MFDDQPPLPAAAQAYAERVTAWAARPLPPQVAAWRDVAYGTHPAQRLDVFAPRGARDAAVLVFWHGGGWTNGYRHWVHFMAAAVVQHGLVLVAPSYRLVQQARLPAALDDAAAALQFVAQRAADWGGSGERLLLSGHSAGGHIAAMTALAMPALPSGVCACLPISGIMDLHHPAPPPASLEERVYTSVLSAPDDDAAFSPVCWARGNTLRFDLSFGEHDSERVQRSNRRLHSLLRRQPGAVALTVQAGADHFSSHTDLADAGHPWYARVTRLANRSA